MSKNKLYRIGIIIFVLMFILYKNIINIFSYKNSINMFHLGEKISSSTALILFDKKPITEIFVLHGYFLEVLESTIAFKIFGFSLGSYLFFDTLLIVISYLLFLIILNKSLRNNAIFTLAIIFFIGTNLLFRIVNNFLFFIFILISTRILKRTNLNWIYCFFQSFLVFFNFIYAVEQAYYGLLSIFIFSFLFIFVVNKNSHNKIKLTYKLLSAYSLGFLLFISTGLLILRPSGLIQYVSDLLFIPKLGYALFSRNFPPFSLKYFYPYYLPFTIVLSNLLFITYVFIKKKIKTITTYTFILIIGLFYFESIFARADLNFIFYDKNNINFFMWPMFLCSFIGLDHLMSINKRSYKNLLFLFLLIMQLAPFFIYKNFFIPNNLKSEQIFSFLSLPKYPDNFWISNEQQKISEYIQSNTTSKDWLYVFDNESMYYYLTKRNNPTRYYIATFAQLADSQNYVINQLKTFKPKYVIYNSNYWSNNLDDIPQKKRLYKINDWLLKNYQHSIKIDSTTLLY